jgi:hypothetical protein
MVSIVVKNEAYLRDLTRPEPVVFPELDRTARAIQIEHRFMFASYHMHMGRPTVVRVYDDAEPVEPQDRGHDPIVP